MTVSRRFAAVMTGLDDDEHLDRSDSSRPADAALLPDRLSLGCTRVLPVAAAGLSFTFTTDRRLPVGASDPAAATAERLQFALGEGPCLTAHDTQTTQSAGRDDIARRWPVYAAELTARTPFRSVIALPLPGWLGTLVTLELYLRTPRISPTLLATEVDTVAGLIADHLIADMTTSTDLVLGQPGWLSTTRVSARHQVWMALGMLKAQRNESSAQSLTRLRAHAFVHATDLETAATRILAGEIPDT